jgi:cytochrome c oxidase assembly protein subunit 15
MFTFPYSQWVGGIFYEHGHRLIASTVGFMTIILAAWLWRADRRRWMRWLGVIALGAVILQGILGGLTVRYLLPAPISVFHACLAQAYFCLVVTIAVCTSPRWRRPAFPPCQTTPHVPWLCAALFAVVLLQLLLGAVMRHTESGLAVPDFPLAYGRLVPDLSASAVDRYNFDRRWTYQLDPITVDQIVYHLLHRAGALCVAAVLLATAGVILRRHGDIRALRWPAILAVILLAVQIGLGAWTVWSGKAPRVTTGHVAVGAALMADAWLLVLMSRRFLQPVSPEPAVCGAPALTSVSG